MILGARYWHGARESNPTYIGLEPSMLSELHRIHIIPRLSITFLPFAIQMLPSLTSNGILNRSRRYTKLLANLLV